MYINRSNLYLYMNENNIYSIISCGYKVKNKFIEIETLDDNFELFVQGGNFFKIRINLI